LIVARFHSGEMVAGILPDTAHATVQKRRRRKERQRAPEALREAWSSNIGSADTIECVRPRRGEADVLDARKMVYTLTPTTETAVTPTPMTAECDIDDMKAGRPIVKGAISTMQSAVVRFARRL
jgi:hypothetical protein